jgi:hypothetical protein
MRFFPIIALMFLCALPSSWSQELTCNPCIYGFGKVNVGTSVPFSIRLKNTGARSLSILSKLKVGKEFYFGNFPLPVRILPGHSVMMPIVFKPTATGRELGEFTLLSNALDPKLTVHVAGIGVSGAQLTLSPSSLNFGSVTLGHSATLPTTLKATNGAVTITSDQITSSEYVLGGITPPVTIASGSSLPVKVKFTPGQAGTANAKIGYFSDAAISPEVELLTGTGVAPGSHSVSLNWQDSGQGIVGYNIYRGITHGGPYTIINTALDASTNYTDSAVAAGATYYYVTTAVDSADVESTYSNETKAVIPSP